MSSMCNGEKESMSNKEICRMCKHEYHGYSCKVKNCKCFIDLGCACGVDDSFCNCYGG